MQTATGLHFTLLVQQPRISHNDFDGPEKGCANEDGKLVAVGQKIVPQTNVCSICTCATFSQISTPEFTELPLTTKSIQLATTKTTITTTTTTTTTTTSAKSIKSTTVTVSSTTVTISSTSRQPKRITTKLATLSPVDVGYTNTSKRGKTVLWIQGPKGPPGADGLPGSPGAFGVVGLVEDFNIPGGNFVEMQRVEDIRNIIQRQLLSHVYNPSQFLKGPSALAQSGAPYIPYAQIRTGNPGSAGLQGMKGVTGIQGTPGMHGLPGESGLP
ncbi:unnamed protein product, partial [Didymodactylos carnosus]